MDTSDIAGGATFRTFHSRIPLQCPIQYSRRRHIDHMIKYFQSHKCLHGKVPDARSLPMRNDDGLSRFQRRGRYLIRQALYLLHTGFSGGNRCRRPNGHTKYFTILHCAGQSCVKPERVLEREIIEGGKRMMSYCC